MRTFTHPEQQRFWTVRRAGAVVFTTYGKVGSKGRSMEKKHKDETDAIAQMNGAISKKRDEGYAETTVYETLPALAPEGAALEQALADNPDDLAAHMAYADWLSEQPDARLAERGELIRVQLALEDQSKKGQQRGALKRREKKLLAAQQRLYFGELSSFFLDGRSDDLPGDSLSPGESRADWSWERGWVPRLVVHSLSAELAEALGRSPGMRLLRLLTIRWQVYMGSPFPGFAKARYLTNVRDLDMAADDATGAEQLIACLPRVERIWLRADDVPLAPLFRLRNLEHLRALSLEEIAEDFPLADLAKNPALGRLEKLELIPSDRFPLKTTRDYGDARIGLADVRALVRSKYLTSLTNLTIHRSDMGDAGVKAIIESRLLARLKVLILYAGCITDKGARALAACPEARNLDRLDISNNRLTNEGLQALARAGIKVDSSYQQEPGENGYFDDGYLYTEDLE